MRHDPGKNLGSPFRYHGLVSLLGLGSRLPGQDHVCYLKLIKIVAKSGRHWMRKSPTVTYDIGHSHRYEQGLVGSVKSLLIEMSLPSGSNYTPNRKLWNHLYGQTTWYWPLEGGQSIKTSSHGLTAAGSPVCVWFHYWFNRAFVVKILNFVSFPWISYIL